MLPIVVHPAFTHFPLAMFSAAWVCVLLLHRGGDDAWDARARLFEIIGVAFLPITIVLGFVDDGGIGVFTSPEWDDPLIWHALGALVASGLFAWHWQWRRGLDLAGVRAAAVLDVGLSTAGLWLFVLAGAIAGEMVHG